MLIFCSSHIRPLLFKAPSLCILLSTFCVVGTARILGNVCFRIDTVFAVPTNQNIDRSNFSAHNHTCYVVSRISFALTILSIDKLNLCFLTYKLKGYATPKSYQMLFFFPSFLTLLAYRPAPRTFQLALRGYSVASLPRASRFALASRSLRSRAFRASRSRKFSKKKSVSQST